MRRTAITALVALMVALAGCGATTQGGLTTTQTDDATNAIEPTSGMGSASTGTIAFYVSDQPAAIEDFEHLNVTIERIGLKPAGADDDEDASDAAESDDGNESDDENETTTTVTTTATTTNETTEETSNTSTTTTTETPENETTEAPENESEDDEAADEQDEEEREGEESEAEEDEEEREDEAADEQDEEEREGEEDDEKAGWVTYDVDNRTVDLTELQGENATRLANLSAPSGTYTTVFVYVSDVHGVLKNGEEVRVKLPSQKLQLHTTFEIGANGSTDFVYDIAVHKAGNSGKYILKPNIAESGTDVPIRDVDREREHEGEMNDGMDEHGDEEMDEHDEEDGEHDDMNESEGEHGQDESEMGEGHDGNGMDDQDGNEMDDQDGDGMDDESEQGEGEPGDGADHEDRFSIALDGNVTAGGTVTVSVTNAQDKAVSGATVSVNGDSVGETDGDGELEITVPEGAEELEITVRTPGGAEIELERTLEG